MICEIFPLRSKAGGAHPTVSYVLGVTGSKRGHNVEYCQYLTDNGIGLAMDALPSKQTSISKTNRHLAAEATSVIEDQARKNRRARKPFWHCVISLSPEDAGLLTETDWDYIVHSFMQDMGFGACRWIAAVHRDTGLPHVHVVACTVQDCPDYPVVKRYGDYRRAEALMRRFEEEYGLRRVSPPEASSGINHPQRKTGKAALRDVIDHCVEELKGASSNPDITDLVKWLQFYGVNTRCQWRDGQPRGFSFEMDGWKSAGSKLGGNGAYSLAGLRSRGIALERGNTIDELWEMTTSGHSKPAHESPQPISVEKEETDTRADPEITKSFRVAISLPTDAAKALETSGLIKQPVHADYSQPEAVWEYRIAITSSSSSKDESMELIRMLVDAILRLVEQLLQLLGFNIVLTSTAASWFPDDFAEPAEIQTVPDNDSVKETIKSQLTPRTVDQTFEDHEKLRPCGQDPTPM